MVDPGFAVCHVSPESGWRVMMMQGTAGPCVYETLGCARWQHGAVLYCALDYASWMQELEGGRIGNLVISFRDVM